MLSRLSGLLSWRNSSSSSSSSNNNNNNNNNSTENMNDEDDLAVQKTSMNGMESTLKSPLRMPSLHGKRNLEVNDGDDDNTSQLLLNSNKRKRQDMEEDCEYFIDGLGIHLMSIDEIKRELSTFGIKIDDDDDDGNQEESMLREQLLKFARVMHDQFHSSRITVKPKKRSLNLSNKMNLESALSEIRAAQPKKNLSLETYEAILNTLKKRRVDINDSGVLEEKQQEAFQNPPAQWPKKIREIFLHERSRTEKVVRPQRLPMLASSTSNNENNNWSLFRPYQPVPMIAKYANGRIDLIEPTTSSSLPGSNENIMEKKSVTTSSFVPPPVPVNEYEKKTPYTTKQSIKFEDSNLNLSSSMNGNRITSTTANHHRMSIVPTPSRTLSVGVKTQNQSALHENPEEVAKRILNTLGKISTPLEDARFRRPPQWAVSTPVDSSKPRNSLHPPQASSIPSKSLLNSTTTTTTQIGEATNQTASQKKQEFSDVHSIKSYLEPPALSSSTTFNTSSTSGITANSKSSAPTLQVPKQNQVTPSTEKKLETENVFSTPTNQNAQMLPSRSNSIATAIPNLAPTTPKYAFSPAVAVDSSSKSFKTSPVENEFVFGSARKSRKPLVFEKESTLVKETATSSVVSTSKGDDEMMNSSLSSSSFAIYKPPPPGSWKCPTCLVRNNPDALVCPCCETKKPGSSSETSSSTAAALTADAVAQKEQAPAFSFVPKQGFASNNNDSKISTNVGFERSFANVDSFSSSSSTSAPIFSFGVSKTAKTNEAPSFNFTSTPSVSNSDSTPALAVAQKSRKVTFELAKEKNDSESTTSSESKQPPIFFGAAATTTSEGAAEASSFSFGSTTGTESKPSSSIAASSAPTETKPFSFGSTTATESKPSSSIAASSAPTESKPFSFGSTVTSSAPTESKPFSFGSTVTSSAPTETKPFSFGSTTATESKPPSSIAASSAPTESKPFSFGSTTVTESKSSGFFSGTGTTAPAIVPSTEPKSSTSFFFGAATSATSAESKPLGFGSTISTSNTSELKAAPSSFTFASAGAKPTTGFGNNGAIAPGPALSNPPSSFGFGSTGATAFGTTSTFGFGASQPSAPTSNPATSSFGNPATSSFGNPASTPFGNPGTPSFGFPAPTSTQPSTGMFGNASTPSSNFGTGNGSFPSSTSSFGGNSASQFSFGATVSNNTPAAGGSPFLATGGTPGGSGGGLFSAGSGDTGGRKILKARKPTARR